MDGTKSFWMSVQVKQTKKKKKNLAKPDTHMPAESTFHERKSHGVHRYQCECLSMTAKFLIVVEFL